MPIWVKPVQMDLGFFSAWVALAVLVQNTTKRTWVALQCGLLIPIWVKPVQMDMGCSSAWVSEAVLVKNNSKRTWVALQCGLLILFWVQLVQIPNGLLFSVGCSSYFGSN